MIKGKNKIDVSVIIPVYNVEDYLSVCVDSVMRQKGLSLEIILINDGSTDSSGLIADQYANRYSWIRTIHKKNGGASSARNAGLDLAQGEYIAFIDSDDWVKEDSLTELYSEAIKHQADMISGNILTYHLDGRIDNLYNRVPKEICNRPFSGKEGFILLNKSKAYLPMVFNYLFKRSFLENIGARFEEGIMHEDELWTPVALCQAETIANVDLDFYYYRQREGSVMGSSNRNKRLDSLFRVTDRLIEFAGRFDFSGEDGEMKSWLYVIIYRLYSWAFLFLSQSKDSSNIVPAHHLDCFWRDCREMTPEPQKICNNYFKKAEENLKKYTDWRRSEWVASVASQIKTGKKLMLIYNTPQGEVISLEFDDVPADWIITTDRRYIFQADVVVFHLPDMQQNMESDLHKLKEQIWVAWCLKSEKNHPFIKSPEVRVMFDLWMSSKQVKNKDHPFVRLCREIDHKFFLQPPRKLSDIPLLDKLRQHAVTE